jgi:hypothetical protein
VLGSGLRLRRVLAVSTDRVCMVLVHWRKMLMDGHRFDGFTRALCLGLSRRETLTMLGAALSGSGLLAALPEKAAALNRKQRRQCKSSGGKICSKGTKRACCARKNGTDGPGTCVNGACSCDATQTFAITNGCPASVDGQCGCFPYVGASGSEGACADPGGCNLDRPCSVNADCDPGTFCDVNCPSIGQAHCTFPCKSV